jgi:hypothetical protein
MNRYKIDPQPDVNDVPPYLLTRYEADLAKYMVMMPSIARALSQNSETDYHTHYVACGGCSTSLLLVAKSPTVWSQISRFSQWRAEGSTAIELLFGPHNRRWIATVTRTVEEYIHIQWNPVGGAESSSCTASIHDLGFGSPKLIGVVSLVEYWENPPVPYRPRILVGAICFGTQCTLANCGFGDLAGDHFLNPDEREKSLLEAAIARASAGLTIDGADEEIMRKFFRLAPLPVDRFRILFNNLIPYLKMIRDEKRLYLGAESLDFVCEEPASNPIKP